VKEDEERSLQLGAWPLGTRIADENPGAGASSRAGGSLTLTDDERAGTGRLQLVVSSIAASTNLDDRFKSRGPFGNARAMIKNVLRSRYDHPKKRRWLSQIGSSCDEPLISCGGAGNQSNSVIGD